MRTKLFSILSLVLILSMVLTACGTKATPAPVVEPTKAPVVEPTKAPEAKPAALKVGLVTDVGGVNDKSFNQSAWAGVQKAVTELGVEAKFIESKQATDYEKNIDAFATEGYNVIVTVGFLMGDATAKKAMEYPNVKFAIIDNAFFPTEGSATCPATAKDCYADGGLTNVTSLMFQEDEVGYLAGVLAACMSKTGVIGSVAGMEIPPVVRFITGYQNGAKSVNPNVKTLNQYIPSFVDPAKGKEVGLAMIAQKADVIFGCGGNTGNGGLTAAKEKGAMGIGVDVDQYLTFADAKDILITSAAKNVDVAVFDAIKNLAGKTLKAGILTANLKNGGVGLAPYHDWDSKISQECKDKVTAATEDLKSGKAKTGYGEAAAAPAAKALKVGLVTDVGGVNDKSFNQSAWAGVQKAVTELGVEAKFIESKQATDYEKNIDAFATEGYNVIVTVGFLMGDATAKKAMEYPNVKFAIIDNAFFPTEGSATCPATAKDCYADGGLTNVTSLMFQEDEVGYLAGVLAACMSKTGVIGSVAGMEIPPVVRFITGYQNGAKSVNPNVKTLNQYIPSFVDPAKGKEVGLAMIAQKADVIFGCGGNTGNGGLTAAKEKGAMGIGVDVDQYLTFADAKDILITSAAKNVDVAVFEALKAAASDSLKAGIATANLKNGGVGLAPYHDWDSKISQECKDKVTAATADLIAGKAKTGYGEAAAAPAAKALKVGLVTDVGGVNDKSFNQSAWAGVQKAVTELGVEAKFIESKQATDYEKNIDAFATEGYNVIVTVGFLMGDATAKKAMEYPNVKFAIIDNAFFPTEGSATCPATAKDCYADGGLTNVTSLMFQEDEVGYLAGVLAACMSKTGVIGSVAGMEIPPVVRFITGYQNGAKSVNPNVKTLNQYIPSFVDPAKGKEVGLAMIAQKADVIFGCGGNTGNGGLTAAKEKGAMGIGVDVDQYLTFADAKDILITSAAKNVDVAVFEALKAAASDSLKAGIATANLKNGGVGLAPYHDWDSKISADCKAKVATATADLIAGKAKTGYQQ